VSDGDDARRRWLLDDRRGRWVFAYATPGFYGSTGNIRTHKPVVEWRDVRSWRYWSSPPTAACLRLWRRPLLRLDGRHSTLNEAHCRHVVDPRRRALGTACCADGGIFAFATPSSRLDGGSGSTARFGNDIDERNAVATWLVASDAASSPRRRAQFHALGGKLRPQPAHHRHSSRPTTTGATSWSPTTEGSSPSGTPPFDGSLGGQGSRASSESRRDRRAVPLAKRQHALVCRVGPDTWHHEMLRTPSRQAQHATNSSSIRETPDGHDRCPSPLSRCITRGHPGGARRAPAVVRRAHQIL